MTRYTVTFQPDGRSIQVPEGSDLLLAQIAAGLRPDAPCGGKGTCGKCSVQLDGREVVACQTGVDRDMVVFTGQAENTKILTSGIQPEVHADGSDDYVLAFDVGTTTVVAYLLDGHTGSLLAQESCMNPQSQFGGDVISRIQYAMKDGSDTMSACVRSAMQALAKLCALSRAEFDYAVQLAKDTKFLELASLPQFQGCYVDALDFSETEKQ